MWVYDFEVFKYDWLVVFHHIESGETVKIVNDHKGLLEFYNKNSSNLFIGFNNSRYDDYIFKVALLGNNPYRANQIIIEENNIMKLFRLYQINKFPVLSYDVMMDSGRGSLKEFEGWLGMNIEESSVPFDIDRPLTQAEIKDTFFYCEYDVKATLNLFKAIQPSVVNRFRNVKYFGLDAKYFGKTNAKMSAELLNAQGSREWAREEFIGYEPVETLELAENADLLEFFKTIDYTQAVHRNIAGVPHVIKYGGIHGARPKFIYKGKMWLLDVGSYYPSMMIEYDFLSRQVKGVSRKKFKEMYDLRMSAKHTGDKVASNANKLVLNTTYGCMKDKYNALYDPRMANNVCITGQLLLIDLIEKLKPYMTLVQSNTDGILVIPKDEDKIVEIVDEWQKRTGMKMEIEIYTEIYQKDVNNYLVKSEDGYLKAKGSHLIQAEQVRTDYPKKSLKILDDCVVDYFINGTLPSVTIQNSNDPLDFQIITKTGKTFKETVWVQDGESEVSVNKVNRVFATTNTRRGGIFKVKDVKGVRRYHKLANTPPHCRLANDLSAFDMAQLDREWYLEMAIKRLKGFGVNATRL